MQYTQYSTTNKNNQTIFASKTVLPYLYAPVGVVGLSASGRHKTAPNTRPRFRRVDPGVPVDAERSDDLGKALSRGLAAKTRHPVPGWAADTLHATNREGCLLSHQRKSFPTSCHSAYYSVLISTGLRPQGAAPPGPESNNAYHFRRPCTTIEIIPSDGKPIVFAHTIA